MKGEGGGCHLGDEQVCINRHDGHESGEKKEDSVLEYAEHGEENLADDGGEQEVDSHVE